MLTRLSFEPLVLSKQDTDGECDGPLSVREQTANLRQRTVCRSVPKREYRSVDTKHVAVLKEFIFTSKPAHWPAVTETPSVMTSDIKWFISTKFLPLFFLPHVLVYLPFFFPPSCPAAIKKFALVALHTEPTQAVQEIDQLYDVFEKVSKKWNNAVRIRDSTE